MAVERTAAQVLESPLDGDEEVLFGLRLMIAETGRIAELGDTPSRVLQAFREMTRGYLDDPQTILATRFDVDADEIVVVKDIDFVSLCEHHLLPFSGVAHVGYLPAGEVVGLSKIPRLVDCFARRLQVQERLTNDIARTMQDELGARGVGVVVSASHTCLTCRGAMKQRAAMVTSAMLGTFRNDRAARQELLELIGL